MDEISNNEGNQCLVKWTNSFVEIHSILERNAREHDASFVLFTGNVLPVQTGDSNSIMDGVYTTMRSHKDNFVVTTLDGIDSELDGMRPRKRVGNAWKGEDDIEDKAGHHVY